MIKNDLKQNNLSFQGLTKILSKGVHSKSTIRKLVKAYPKSNGVVGSLPYDWIKNIDNSKRGEASKQIFQCMTSFAKRMRASKDVVRKIADFNMVREGAFRNMQKTLNAIGVPIKEVSFLSTGSFGSVYKLTVDAGLGKQKHYVLKVFEDVLDERYILHGNYREQNVALFANKHRNNFKTMNGVRTYFSDFNSGYMVNEFIDEELAPIKRYENPVKKGLFVLDGNPENLINGRLIDYGGIVYFGKNPSAKLVKETVRQACCDPQQVWMRLVTYLPMTDEVQKGLKESLEYVSKYNRPYFLEKLEEFVNKWKKGVQ